MTTIFHNQTPSATVDLCDLGIRVDGDNLIIEGTATLHGDAMAVAGAFPIAPALCVYLTADGDLTTDGAQAFAHVAWVENDEVHGIRHVEPPDEGQPVTMEALADLLTGDTAPE